MKRKIIAFALVACLAITAIAGASLAYLMDTDTEDNVFTVGNVRIDLYEDFDEDNANLMPSTGKDKDGNIINAIEKKVYVSNEGTSDAYVRVHIAIPTILDDGDPTFDASKNVLHFNYDEDSVAEGKWNWSKTVDGTTGSNWNSYQTTIGGISYNVYVVTYETALTSGQATEDAMNQVYLDGKVTNEDIESINDTLGENWHIHVIAEGTQAQGFADAYVALNTSFGVPGAYEINWTAADDVDTVKGE